MREIPGETLHDHEESHGKGERGAAAEGPESSSPSSKMTFGEMRDALADENHPRHDEAIQQGKRMSTELGPAMEELKKSLSIPPGISQFAGNFKDLSVSARDASTALVDSVKAIQPIISSVDVPPENDALQFTPPVAHVSSFDFDEINEELNEAVREKEARQQRNDKIAADSLEVLQAMAASIQQLDQKLGDVEQRLIENDMTAKDSSGKTITIAAWTLFSTVLGIAVATVLAVVL